MPPVGRGMPVRGWLLVLCLLLTVWNPMTLAAYAAGRLADGAALPSAVAALVAVRLVVTGVGVAAGLALWNRRPGGVALAKASLLLSALEVAARLAAPAGFSNVPPGLRLPLAAASIAFDGLWYAYLEKSRRVRATFDLM